VQYFALDLSLPILKECMEQLLPCYRVVQCHGLWGTFNDGLEWARKIETPKCWMSLGSMFGNDHFPKAVQRLSMWAHAMLPQDRMLLGLDATQDRDIIWRSYHDDQGLFHSFIRNGFMKSNQVLGHVWFRPEEWQLTGEYQSFPLMHRFTMTALRDVRCDPLCLRFRKDEKIVCYEGFKYDPIMVQKQFVAAGLSRTQIWKSPSGRIYQYLTKHAMV